MRMNRDSTRPCWNCCNRIFGSTFRSWKKSCPETNPAWMSRKYSEFSGPIFAQLKGWEVVERAVLGTFSFTKYLMWKDLEERSEALKRNPVVKHLIETPTQSFNDGIVFPEPRELDRDYSPEQIFAPLSADSSQLSAVLAAAKGKNFVLFGPPGTGKSQTITNMIAQCLAEKKTVLFVAQKTAALEVVMRRLKEIGLQDHALEIHSAKAQKSVVIAQLKEAWYSRAPSSARNWTEATVELKELRNKLNLLVAALHEERSNGLTAYQAFGVIVANRDRFKNIAFVPVPISSRTALICKH